MSILKFTVGKSGAGGANSDYITRVSAAEKISFHNLEHLESDDIAEARTNAIAYAHAREEIELAKNKSARTHYRMIVSFEGKKTSEEATEEVGKYLKQEFPDGRAIIAVHQDTDDTHVHVWLDSRKTDGRKVQIDDKQYHALDERWTAQYDARYGTNYAPEYKAKKEETTHYKREMLEWRTKQADGLENTCSLEQTPPAKPERARNRMKADYWRAKEIQELSGSKELPEPRNQKKPSAVEARKPVQPIEEKKQIIEQQVESYLLDLQKMMRVRRERAITEAIWAMSAQLVKNGIPIDRDKIRDHAIRAVDHFIDQGSYRVRNRIREVVERGSHLGEQITLADRSGSDAMHDILRDAADDSRIAVIKLSLENYGKEFNYRLGETFSLRAGQIIMTKTGALDGAGENYEKSGYGTDYPTAQSGSRSVADAERAAAREQSESGILEPPKGRGIESAQRSEPAASGGNALSEIPAIGGGAGARSSDGAQRALRTDSGESGTTEFSGHAVKSDEFPGAQLHVVSGAVAKRSANQLADERKSAKYFYDDQLGKGQFGARASAAGIPGSLAGVEDFAVTTVEIFPLPLIETFEPQFVVNKKALAEAMMNMMKTSLAAQDIQLSRRAERIYEAQLKRDGVTTFTAQELEIINTANLARPEEERFSTAGKSKLEIAHESMIKASDERHHAYFALMAKHSENKVKLEQREELQERRGMTLSM